MSAASKRPSWRRPALPRATLTRLASEGASVELQRIDQLERNALFMREQHKETLQALHKEIERLKADNRGTFSSAIDILIDKYCNRAELQGCDVSLWGEG